MIERAKAYFLEAARPQFATALHRKKMRGATLPNEYSLLVWQARVLERACAPVEDEKLPQFRLDDRWLPVLAQLTRRNDGPKRARGLLAKHGIVVVNENIYPGPISTVQPC